MNSYLLKNILFALNLTQIRAWLNQGILSVLGIAGYEWVPARIGRFGNNKYLFLKYQ